MSDRRFRKLVRLRPTAARDADVDEEFRFHLDMRMRELEAAGRTREDAHREALRQFGDIDDARTVCRAEDNRRMREFRWTNMIDTLRQDVVLTLRTLRQQPAFAASTLVTLGVALALTTTAYAMVHAYLIRPLPYPDPDRLVYVIAGPTRDPFPNAPSLARVDWRSIDSVFAETVAWDLDGYTLAGGDRPEYVDGAWVSPGYFRALGMQPTVGRGFLADEYVAGSQVAIISDALWSRRFGRDPAAVGSTMRAHSTDRPRDDELVTIVGVMPADAWHISQFTDVLRPLSTPRFASIARLKDGMSRREAESRLNAVIGPQLGQVDPNWRMTLVSVQDEYTYQLRPTLTALLGAAVFLLLVGAASVAGTQTARAAARRAEIQVRMALGATRSRIMRQLLTETVMIALLAGVIGVALTALTLSVVGPAAGEHLGAGVPGGAHTLRFQPGLLALSLGAGAFVGTVFGILPALATLRMTGRGTGGSGSQRGSARSHASPTLRRGLIVAQVAVTMMLLVGAGLMTRTLFAIGASPLGFEASRVLKANLLLPQARYPDGATRRSGIDRLLVRLHDTPGIVGAAVVSPHPFRGVGQSLAITAEGRDAAGELGARAVSYVVTEQYFDVMQIPVRRGRGFSAADDALSAPSVIVSEALARELWPQEDGIGRRIRIGGDTVWRTIVGTSGDTREPVEAVQEPEVYLPYAQVPRPYVSIVSRVSGDPTSHVSRLQGVAAEVDDAFALADVEPLADAISRNSRRQRALATVLSAFGAFALAIAMLGLFASLTYVVSQRRREIAIRVAVGAQSANISTLVLKEGAILVALGAFSGALISMAITRVLSTQLYGVTPTDPITFAAIAVLLALAGLASAVPPIRIATRIQPSTVLTPD